MIEASESEWAELNRRYREVFGEAIPTMELPADWPAARALIELAISKKDDSVFHRDISTGSVV